MIPVDLPDWIYLDAFDCREAKCLNCGCEVEADDDVFFGTEECRYCREWEDTHCPGCEAFVLKHGLCSSCAEKERIAIENMPESNEPF